VEEEEVLVLVLVTLPEVAVEEWDEELIKLSC
jgi:hypothetical protein